MKKTALPKVVHIITTLERGGAEKQLVILCKEQIRIGLKCSVLYLKGDGELESELISNGINTMKLNSALKYYQFIKQMFIDKKMILHAHLPRAEVLAYLTIILLKRNFFVSRHNTEKFYPSKPIFISSAISRIILSRSSRVIAISEAVKKHIIENDEIFSNQTNKISVIHYGYDPDFNNESNAKRDYLQHKFMVGSISRLTAQKDLGTLIQAFAIFNRSYPESELVILGEGEDRKKLSELISQLEIAKSVTLPGRSEDVHEFLNKLDVFVLSSRYEGFGLVLLEAMQSNVPILCTNISALPEVVGENFPGLFEVGDIARLSKLLLDSVDLPFARSLTKGYQAQLKKFDPRSMAQKYLIIYEMDKFLGQ